MRSSVRRVQELVRGIVAFDEVEAGHRDEALRWLASTDDVFRRVKPAIPSPHLVSYVVVIDPVDRSSLLVDHLNASDKFRHTAGDRGHSESNDRRS